MPNYEPSLSERKRKLFEDIKEEMMTAGNGGFTAAAPAEGPVAGYDPVMGKGRQGSQATQEERSKRGKWRSLSVLDANERVCV